MEKNLTALQRIVIALLVFYQRGISPWTPPSCRFYPSCSSYTKQAIEHYGVFKGLYCGLKRLLRCHPWSEGGFDPLPSTHQPETQPQRPLTQKSDD